MSGNKIHYSLKGSIAILQLDDGKVNTIDPTFVSELSAALDRSETEAKAVIVRGRENCFGAGLDLKVIPALEPSQLYEFLRDLGRLMYRLWLHPRPVLAAVTGHMIAGGAVTALCCDRRIAAEGAYRVGLNEVAIGLTLPRFVLEIAKATLPPHVWSGALLFGELYDPATAVRLGFLDRLVSADQLDAAVLQEAERLSTLPERAFAESKRALRQPVVDRALASEANDLNQFFEAGPFRS